METLTRPNQTKQSDQEEQPSTTTPAPFVMPEAVTRRGIDEPQWRTLMLSLFPGARAESVLMVIDYCKVRKLDPLKKPCHIVPVRVKNAGGNYEWRDVVMPGIYEYRTTAMRTGLYLGHSKPEYGPALEPDLLGVKAPEWCEMTFYRRASNGERIEFPVRVYFVEACAVKDGKANDRWKRAPIQMLTKCTEAAGLREAFPDEFGGESTAEEMEGRGEPTTIEAVAQVKPAERKSEQQRIEPAKSDVVIEQAKSEPEPAKVEQAQPVVEPEPFKVDAPPKTKSIGVVADIRDAGKGAIIVVLDSGYAAGTRDPLMAEALTRYRETKQRIEITAPPPKKAGVVSIIESIDVLAE